MQRDKLPLTDLITELKEENEVLSKKYHDISEKCCILENQLKNATKENRKLQNDLNKIASGGQNCKNKMLSVDASCQTAISNIGKKLGDMSQNIVLREEPGVLTAKSIAEAAQSALNDSGWVYDKSTGTYFDYNTNLYYYPNTRLYYNYTNGCYYKYNQDTQKYEFHYQLESFKQKPVKDGGSKQLQVNNTKAKGEVLPTERMLVSGKRIYMPSLKRAETFCNFVDNEHENGVEVAAGPFKKRKLEVRKTGRFAVLIRKRLMQSKQDYSKSPKKSDKQLSDSEAENIKPLQRQYHLCGSCTSLICNSCCHGRGATKLKKISNTSPKAASGKNQVGMELLKVLKQKDEAFLSDSELDNLLPQRRKFVLCHDCKKLSSTYCCIKKLDLAKQLLHIRNSREFSHYRQERNTISSIKQAPDGDYSSQRAKGCVANNDGVMEEKTWPSTALCKAPIEYDKDINRSCYLEPYEAESATNVIPCIRAMITTSTAVKVGSLFVITCLGATIGSASHCDIEICESGVSAEHAKISYSQEQKNYFITDLGSQTGTSMNSIWVHQPGRESLFPVPVTHKGVVNIGATCLVLHLHLGHETCNDCEPGQIQAMLDKPTPVKISTKREKEALRRSGLKAMKKKFNLHKDQYKQTPISIGPQYTDRAAERRQTVGSDNPYEKDEIPVSLDTQLPAHNKGRQMLEKMGWSEGHGLGKSISGITEPLVPQETSQGKFGLGFGQTHSQ